MKLLPSNPGRPPMGPEGVLLAEAACLAACLRLIRQTTLPERAALVARHLADRATTSQLVLRLHPEAEHLRSFLLRHTNVPEIARVGSGRTQARDCGGRIVAAAERVWDPSGLILDPLDDPPSAACAHVRACERRLALWQAAWPATGRMLQELALLEPSIQEAIESACLEWVLPTPDAAAEAAEAAA